MLVFLNQVPAIQLREVDLQKLVMNVVFIDIDLNRRLEGLFPDKLEIYILKVWEPFQLVEVSKTLLGILGEQCLQQLS